MELSHQDCRTSTPFRYLVRCFLAFGPTLVCRDELWTCQRQVVPAIERVPRENHPTVGDLVNRGWTCRAMLLLYRLPIFFRYWISAKETSKLPARTGLSHQECGRSSEFRYLVRRFLEFGQAATCTDSLSTGHRYALLAIKRLPREDYLTSGDLAARSHFERHSPVGLADRLANAGLIVRKDNADDRRRSVLCRLPPRLSQDFEQIGAAGVEFPI